MIEIANDHLSAAINPHGAELTHLRDADDRELMTAADPAFWPRHAPLLFPAIGKTANGTIRVDGTDYPMSKHGFARDLTFAVTDRGPSHVVFTLTDTPETRAAYPFVFRLDVEFRLDGATLTTEARVTNPADTPLLAQFGFHPAFAWPLPFDQPRADHRIAFDRDEAPDLAAITPDGLIAAEPRPSPLDGRTLHLADALFADDALVWNPVASGSVAYGAATGPHLRIAFPETPRLGIWTMPGASFVCVEPWHGIADPAGFAGDYKDKPGVFEVAPGDTKVMTMSVTLVP
ncbi:aldose 1-epimerase family protein [Microvirga sp. SRT01]|uniref:Aldose 1-epimerase family protein n=1 Tax=Sphingomonas longa TaxID=2778730 RepID=A0ABS2D8F3_9SPHN|nr:MULTISPECIES: aldose 1-epimerase family protein [Alphaproteobacteria]MBM6576314.1 aldose 1-epimerase family protein [Sphingomonas sp. BT552]MBR7709360.1 aldose 1-epimerase family protein [Microvirga sp. SRT01]